MAVNKKSRNLEEASLAIRKAFWEELKKHDLTYNEVFFCLSEINSSMVKYALKAEWENREKN